MNSSYTQYDRKSNTIMKRRMVLVDPHGNLNIIIWREKGNKVELNCPSHYASYPVPDPR